MTVKVCVENMEDQFKIAIQMTEMAIDLKERCALSEKYLVHLKQLFSHANRAIVTLQATSKHCLQQAKIILQHIPGKSQDLDKLLSIIDSQLNQFDDGPSKDVIELDVSLSERIRHLEARYKQFENNNLPPSTSSKSIKSDVDEKYPESWSRDSSIDLNNVVNLPPVPEDVFTSFTSTSVPPNKPKRSSSLSSLKSMRKVKLFLQRAENSDDDEMSSDDDHDFSHKGDSDDGGSPVKKHLGNITEESQFDNNFL